MRDASPAFARIVAGPHRINVRVDLLFDREVIAEGLPIIDGTVSWDRRSEHRAECDVTVAGSVPAATLASLTPYGAELQIWRGVEISGTAEDDLVYDTAGALVTDDADNQVYDTIVARSSDAYTELVSLGIFPIQRVEVDGVTQSTRVAGEDRSDRKSVV